jgi:riboflavin synthase
VVRRVFTGLVEDIGTVAAIEAGKDGARLTITTPLAVDVAEGDSVAVAGACLTATAVAADGFSADVINETLSRTSIGALKQGGAVNLELAMKADGRFGGHIVQGHVDGVGTIAAVHADGLSMILTIAAEPAILRHVVEKGSITVDGVSLTIATVDANEFEVALIPETLERTTLGSAAKGTRVNLETDLFAKYAEKLAVAS